MRSATLAAVLLLVLSACTPERSEPSVWIPLWEQAQAALPDIDAGDPGEESCSRALVELREVAPSLRPTPDDSIDSTVDKWLQIAEETMFECPPDTGEFTSFETAYAELGRLADQIDVVVYDS